MTLYQWRDDGKHPPWAVNTTDLDGYGETPFAGDWVLLGEDGKAYVIREEQMPQLQAMGLIKETPCSNLDTSYTE